MPRKPSSTKPKVARTNGKSKPYQPLKVKVIIHNAEEGGYWAEVPALPGCVTEGDTRAELMANLREAVEGCLLVTPGNFQPAEEGGREEEVAL